MAEKEMLPEELTGIEGAIARSPIYKIGVISFGVIFSLFGLFYLINLKITGIIFLGIGLGSIYYYFKKRQ